MHTPFNVIPHKNIHALIYASKIEPWDIASCMVPNKMLIHTSVLYSIHVPHLCESEHSPVIRLLTQTASHLMAIDQLSMKVR